MEMAGGDTCRICLRAKKVMLPIFNEASNDNIDRKIMRCANVNIEIGDGLPGRICFDCLTLLLSAIIFKDTCERSDRELRKLTDEEIEEDTECSDYEEDSMDENEAIVDPWNMLEVEEEVNMDLIEAQQQSLVEARIFPPIAVDQNASFQEPWVPIKLNTDWKKMDKQSRTLAKTPECLPKAVESTIPGGITGKIIPMRNNIAPVPEMTKVMEIPMTETVSPKKNVLETMRRIIIPASKIIIPTRRIVVPLRDMKTFESLKTAGKSDIDLGKRDTELNSTNNGHISKEMNIPIRNEIIPINMIKPPPQIPAVRIVLPSRMMTKVPTGKIPKTVEEISKIKRDKQLKSKERKRLYMAANQKNCNVCGKVFYFPSHLRYHMWTHMGELPFQCPVCPHRSRLKESLKTHMRRHTGERPFSCPHCPMRFTTPSNRLNHVRRHENTYNHKVSVG